MWMRGKGYGFELKVNRKRKLIAKALMSAEIEMPIQCMYPAANILRGSDINHRVSGKDI